MKKSNSYVNKYISHQEKKYSLWSFSNLWSWLKVNIDVKNYLNQVSLTTQQGYHLPVSYFFNCQYKPDFIPIEFAASVALTLQFVLAYHVFSLIMKIITQIFLIFKSQFSEVYFPLEE